VTVEVVINSSLDNLEKMARVLEKEPKAILRSGATCERKTTKESDLN
jgi:hypothetical protein